MGLDDAGSPSHLISNQGGTLAMGACTIAVNAFSGTAPSPAAVLTFARRSRPRVRGRVRAPLYGLLQAGGCAHGVPDRGRSGACALAAVFAPLHEWASAARRFQIDVRISGSLSGAVVSTRMTGQSPSDLNVSDQNLVGRFACRRATHACMTVLTSSSTLQLPKQVVSVDCLAVVGAGSHRRRRG